jgi:hypothetical protein
MLQARGAVEGEDHVWPTTSDVRNAHPEMEDRDEAPYNPGLYLWCVCYAGSSSIVALMIVRRIRERLASGSKDQPTYHWSSAEDDLTTRLEILRLVLGALPQNGTSGTVSSTSSEAA